MKFWLVEQDKILHIIALALVALIFAALIGIAKSIALSLVIGITKELVDKIGLGTPSFKDLLASIIGILIGIFACWLIYAPIWI